MIENSIEEWFSTRGFRVEIEPEKREDRVFDKLARYLGDNFADIEKFLSGLYWTLTEGKITRQALHKLSASERQHTLEFAKLVNDLGLLEHYNYNEAEQKLSFKVGNSTQFRSFLGGFWLERYALVKAKQQLESSGREFLAARNLRLAAKQSGATYELDVFLLVDGEPIWIECKSRNYRHDIRKYVERAGELGVPLERMVLIAHRIEPEIASDLSDMYGIFVVPIDQFGSIVQRIASEGEIGHEAGEIGHEAELSRILLNAQMSPHPNERRRVLQALLDAALEDLPATVGEIRERMLSSVPEDVRSAVHPVLMAVRRGGGLLTAMGEPDKGTGLETTIAKLAVEDIWGLEELCQDAYRDAIEKQLPGVFDDPGALEDFEDLVDPSGSKVSVVSE